MNWKTGISACGVIGTLFLFQNCGNVDTSQSLLSLGTEVEEPSTGGGSTLDIQGESQAFSVPVGDPPVVTASCDISEMSLDWPMSGENGSQWWISRYVDRNPGVGAVDYAGGAKTSDGFQQIEIRAPFLSSNGQRLSVRSMEAGQVVEVVSNFDELILDSAEQCDANQAMRNYVIVEHTNGYRMIYYGIGKGSVPFSVGSSVAKGDVLGTLSSNGCSFSPHVRVELRNCEGVPVSIMENRETLLSGPPPEYQIEDRQILHSVFHTGGSLSIKEFYELSSDMLTVPASAPVFGQHIFVLNIKRDDFIRCVIKEKENTSVVVRTATIDVTSDFETSFWQCNFEMAALSGDYIFEWKINGQTVQEREFKVEP